MAIYAHTLHHCLVQEKSAPLHNLSIKAKIKMLLFSVNSRPQ